MTNWAEDDWERLTEYVPLTAAQAATILGEPVAAVSLLGGGKANTNYVVENARRRAVLRIYERDRTARDRERRLFELVGDAVPRPDVLATGETDGGRPWALLSFVEGAHPHDALTSANAREMGRSIGATLRALESVEPPGARAEIGLLGADLELTRTFESVSHSFVDLVEWSLREGRAGARLGEAAVRLGRVVDRAARELEPIDAWRGLAHGDFKWSNLLVRDAVLVAVLDWEFASAFTPLLDVAIHMRHRDDFPAVYVMGFEEGHGALPADWQRLSRIMDLMNLVGFLNASGRRPRLYDAVTARIVETIDLL